MHRWEPHGQSGYRDINLYVIKEDVCTKTKRDTVIQLPEKQRKKADRMPRNIYEVYRKLNQAAGIHGLEIIGLRDKYAKKEWIR